MISSKNIISTSPHGAKNGSESNNVHEKLSQTLPRSFFRELKDIQQQIAKIHSEEICQGLKLQ